MTHRCGKVPRSIPLELPVVRGVRVHLLRRFVQGAAHGAAVGVEGGEARVALEGGIGGLARVGS